MLIRSLTPHSSVRVSDDQIDLIGPVTWPLIVTIASEIRILLDHSPQPNRHRIERILLRDDDLCGHAATRLSKGFEDGSEERNVL